MNRWLPPICFLLAMAMFVAAYGHYAVGPPEVPLALHEARVRGDELATEIMEERFHAEQRRYHIMMYGLFGGGVGMFIVAYLAMRPDK